jgi:DNA-binding TFAR19-related protein (PDSD5 family)
MSDELEKIRQKRLQEIQDAAAQQNDFEQQKAQQEAFEAQKQTILRAILSE